MNQDNRTNNVFIFPEGTSKKMDLRKPSKETYAGIKKQAELLKMRINNRSIEDEKDCKNEK